MIVIDSSVWIANLRKMDSEATRKLRLAENQAKILVGDLVLLEVLRGARSENHAKFLEKELRHFPIVTMLDIPIAIKPAANFRFLRERGMTIRKTPDLIIATFCIERGYVLLHQDRDFEPMALHLGLRVI